LARKTQKIPFEFKFFDNNIYGFPKKYMKHEEILKYIENLPDVDIPEIFGMH
jgi:hypothetical protein